MHKRHEPHRHRGHGLNDPAIGPAEFAPQERESPSAPDQGELHAMNAALRRLLAGNTLTAEETTAAFEAMMSGSVHHAEMGALLALLATRTPTHQEIVGAARVMRKHVTPVRSRHHATKIVDTAGTGGAPKTFNVSTAAAIVAAAAGAVVAKHGNKSRTGRGSAEVLRKLGVNVDAPPMVQQKCLDELDVCFCFAIHHHPATKHVMPVRMALGFPTIFNLLGPLTNPAGAKRQIMGVYDARFLKPIAEAMVELGTVRAMVMHSGDGLDEISISAPTIIMMVDEGSVREIVISPDLVGIEPAPLEEVQARDLEHAAAMINDIFAGKDTGPAREMTLMNAAATLMAAGVADSFEHGIELAREAIDRGAAMEKLKQLAAMTGG